MHIEAITEGKWKVLKLSGRFDAKTAILIDETVQMQVKSLEHKFIAIDLAEITYMSSAGLRVLLAARKMLKAIEGNIVLIAPPDNVMEVLELSGFSRIFFVLNSVEGLSKI